MAEEKKKVLMLDDEKFLLEMYRLSFEKHGYEVSTFYNVDDALQALRGGYKPDVILFDITMPDSRSGYEFIEAVNTERLGRHSLKVALTNEGQEGPMARMSELGTDAHLLKAKYIPSELAAAVEDLVREKRRA
jgi:CheY-like chemotaxis protein